MEVRLIALFVQKQNTTQQLVGPILKALGLRPPLPLATPILSATPPPPQPQSPVQPVSAWVVSGEKAAASPPPASPAPIPATEATREQAQPPEAEVVVEEEEEQPVKEEPVVLGRVAVSAVSHQLIHCDHIAYNLCVRSSYVFPSTGAEATASAHVVSRVRVYYYVHINACGMEKEWIPPRPSSMLNPLFFKTNEPHTHTQHLFIYIQRFAEVHALHQALLRAPTTKAAAKALAPLAPRKTFTWSALATSDVRKATVRRRVEAIPAYLNAVLEEPKVRR